MHRCISIITIVILPFAVQGQKVVGALDSVAKSLRQQNVDTIFGLVTPFTPSEREDTLNGIGIVSCFQMGYVIYRKDARAYAQKLEGYWAGNYINDSVVISKPCEIKNDTIISWISARLGEIKDERIFPYIYIQSKDGVSRYSTVIASHEPWFNICFMAGPNHFWQSVNPDDMEKRRYGFPDNLNYKANESTNLQKVFYMLYYCFEKIDSKFNF